ncbi:MAG: DUF3891 family protein [Leptolyngbyaceae cyanobacterium CSU_1_3]|nr:DUF3891 family protein [Leptolyngbyaceae cyanobacterium CSU_1_3]
MIVNFNKDGWDVIYHRAHALLAAQLGGQWRKVWAECPSAGLVPPISPPSTTQTGSQNPPPCPMKIPCLPPP